MDEYSRQAGAVLRALRKQRDLTLEDVAPLFSMSVSALSRRERGLERIQRSEVEAAIDIFGLTQLEAYALWRAAGLIPSNHSESDDEGSGDDRWRQVMETTLNSIQYPAWFIDSEGYIVAWNHCMEEFWGISEWLDAAPVHSLDVIIFSDRSHHLLGEAWSRAALNLLTYFYHNNLSIIDEPQLHRIHTEYRQKYGAEFSALWQAAQEQAALLTTHNRSMGEVSEVFETEAGPIRLLYLQSPSAYPLQQILFVFLPLGAESQSIYEKYCDGIEPTVFFAERSFTPESQ